MSVASLQQIAYPVFRDFSLHQEIVLLAHQVVKAATLLNVLVAVLAIIFYQVVAFHVKAIVQPVHQ